MIDWLRKSFIVVAIIGFAAACDEGEKESGLAQEVSIAGPSRSTNGDDMGELGEFLSSVDLTGNTDIQRVVSSGGIEAWLVEEHAVPLIAVEVGFKGGSRQDPPGKEGLAYFLSGLLDEGAGELDSQAFQTRLQDLSIRLSFDTGRDGFYGSMRTLSERQDEAFELLRLALTEPRFDEEPVERIRSQILVQLKRAATRPRSIVQTTWFEEAFGEHVYGRRTRGTAETLTELAVEDLKDYLANSLARESMKIAVVGDIDAETLGVLLDRTFGFLPGSSNVAAIENTTVSAEGRLIVIEREQPQSVVMFGGPGIMRDDPDFYAAYVMNNILGGGGFASVLMDEVREKRGLAYGVSTALGAFDHAGLVYGSVATDNERISESLEVIETEMARLRDEGVTEVQLQNAKTYITGSFPLRFDSNSSIANQLVGYQLTGRGIDYINIRNGLIEAVTLEDVNRAAKRLLSPETMIIVVVGKPTGLDASEIRQP